MDVVYFLYYDRFDMVNCGLMWGKGGKITINLFYLIRKINRIILKKHLTLSFILRIFIYDK